MTFWPFYPRKFGALGNSTTDDLAALDACYTAAQNAIQGGESAAIYWEPGAKYGVSGPYYGVKNKHVHLYGRGAVIMALSTFTSASHEGVFQVNASADPSLINLLIQDFTIDINDKNAYGLSCDYASATDTWEIKKSTFRNITVKNNLAGKHCFFFRNLENSVKIENPIVDGWRSTNALPTAAIYCEDRGSGANNGNFYITNPMIGTLSGDVGSPGSYTEGGLGIWIRANGHRINRCYVRGGQLFNWNNHADQGSINCTGVLVDSNDSGAGEKASRTFGIMDLNIEDFKYSIQAKVTGGGSIRNLQARNVSMEYKNPAAESGVRMIEIGTGAISGKLKDLFCMTQVNNATAVHSDSSKHVYVDHIETLTNGGHFGTNGANKFTGSALGADPIRFHLGKVHEFGGPTAQYTGINATRYLPLYGSAATAQATEGGQQTSAKKYYALRQLVLKPDVNTLTQTLPVSFRVAGASVLTANVTAGSTAQVVATASSYVEIDPTELVNFMLAFNAVESGNVRFAVVRAICEEIFSNEGE